MISQMNSVEKLDKKEKKNFNILADPATGYCGEILDFVVSFIKFDEYFNTCFI